MPAFSFPFRLALLPAILLLCTGCATIRGPRVPKAFIITKTQDQAVVDEVANFKKGNCIYNSSEGCKPTRAERDQIIYDLKLIIDRNYQDYARGFEATEDGSSFAGEVSAAALSGTAGIVGTVATKDILSLASTLVQSTSVSAQKNFYQKQTAYAILVVMDSQRADKWSSIYQQMRQNDLDTYPLSAAISDLLDYRQQGTALQALASVQKNAGVNSQQAAASIEKTSLQKLDSKGTTGSAAPKTPITNKPQ